MLPFTPSIWARFPQLNHSGRAISEEQRGHIAASARSAHPARRRSRDRSREEEEEEEEAAETEASGRRTDHHPGSTLEPLRARSGQPRLAAPSAPVPASPRRATPCTRSSSALRSILDPPLPLPLPLPVNHIPRSYGGQWTGEVVGHLSSLLEPALRVIPRSLSVLGKRALLGMARAAERGISRERTTKPASQPASQPTAHVRTDGCRVCSLAARHLACQVVASPTHGSSNVCTVAAREQVAAASPA